MKTIVAFIVFGLIAIAIIVMIVINVMYRNLKRMREDVEDFMYRRGRRQEQKERNPFGEDYFKSSRSADGKGDRGNEERAGRNPVRSFRGRKACDCGRRR